MELSTATDLIRPAVSGSSGQLWWDLGAGSGLFTKALAGLMAEGTIIAMDRDVDAMRSIPSRVGKVETIKQEVDFTRMSPGHTNPSGIIMANALHFVKEKVPFLKMLKSYLSADGVLVIVEYEMTISNPWVPFPVNFASLVKLGKDAGFVSVTKMLTAPSTYQKDGLYSARLGN